MGKSELKNEQRISPMLARRYRELFGHNLAEEQIIEIHYNLSLIADVIEHFVADTSDRDSLQLIKNL